MGFSPAGGIWGVRKVRDWLKGRVFVGFFFFRFFSFFSYKDSKKNSGWEG